MLDEKDLISIIVPVYNVEKYLDRCIDSIINQTYKNIEIILIDDGSTDQSSIICDKYSKLDKRIKIIHRENGGLSSARNAGLDIAKGKLIGFVDSDDYIEPTMYEKLKENMDKYNSDIAICAYYSEYKYLKKKVLSTDKKTIYENKDKFYNLENDNQTLMTLAWNKLYKKEVFNNIKYPEGKIFEDMYIICNLYNNSNKISYIDKPLYHYTMRMSGICGSKKSHYDKIEAINRKIKYYEKENYNDLIIKAKYKKILEQFIYTYKINIKSINEKLVKKIIEDAIKESEEIQDSSYLLENERKVIKSIINNKNKYFICNKIKWNIKETIKNIISY